MKVSFKRKIEFFLENWKISPNKLPLIIRGARQIGKTFAVRSFAKKYKSFVEINFVDNPEFKDIFSDGYSPDSVIKRISFINPNFEFIPGDTLIFLTNCRNIRTVPPV